MRKEIPNSWPATYWLDTWAN